MERQALAAAVGGVLAGLAVAATTLSAAELDDYVLHCAGCHKPGGSGSDAVPALDEVGKLVGVAGGRDYLAQVPGAAQAPLSDQRLADLLNWMVPRFAGVAVEPPYTASEVGTLRAQPLRDPIAARARLLGGR